MSLYKFKISRRPTLLEGIKISESDNLLVFISNPVDFVLDGYGIINKHYLKNEEKINNDTVKEKIINLKVNNLQNEISFLKINNIESLFDSLRKNKMLVHIEFESDDYCRLGIIKEINQDSFLINEINTKGVFYKEERIKFSKIRNIYVKTDYLKSYELFLIQNNR